MPESGGDGPVSGGTVSVHLQDAGGTPLSGYVVSVGVGLLLTDPGGDAVFSGVDPATTSGTLTGDGGHAYTWTSGVPDSGSAAGGSSGSGTVATFVVEDGKTTKVQWVDGTSPPPPPPPAGNQQAFLVGFLAGGV